MFFNIKNIMLYLSTLSFSPTSGNLNCLLMKAFANSLDPDQAPQMNSSLNIKQKANKISQHAKILLIWFS